MYQKPQKAVQSMNQQFPNKPRCVLLGEYIVEHNATVRNAAAHFDVSKSTVHKDVTEKLYAENRRLYRAVAKVLAVNKSERHLRGGEATKHKYLLKRRKQAISD